MTVNILCRHQKLMSECRHKIQTIFDCRTSELRNFQPGSGSYYSNGTVTAMSCRFKANTNWP